MARGSRGDFQVRLLLMRHAPLEPITVPWQMKSVNSAEHGVRRLAGGRLQFWIKHELLQGVTPEMLVWWFNNIDGEVEIEGRRYPRYRIWHPVDHISLTYVDRAGDGAKMGPGARLHIVEMFQARPDYTIDIVATVERLDTGGFAHAEHAAGVEVARMDYRFTQVDGGTLYENELTVGISLPWMGPLFNRLVTPRLFPEHQGHAWIRHNVEEVGNFQFFLPALYHAHVARPAA